MRTKALLLAAAFAAAGVSSSVAQVYSVNAVGYVNLAIGPGYNLIANPLNAGTGNNTVAKIFAPANFSAPIPNGSSVYIFNPATGGYTQATWTEIPGVVAEWGPTAAANTEVLPGSGVFFRNLSGNNLTVTFVGEVMQGSLSTPIPQGFSIKSSQVPQAIKPDSTALPASDRIPSANGDTIYRFNRTTGSYQTFTHTVIPGVIDGFSPDLPTFNVGEAFFYRRLNPATSWNRTFSVN